MSWHARFMVVTWGFLVPLGILAARYFKVMPRQDGPRHLDNPSWWVAHRHLLYLAGLFMVIALVLALVNSAPSRSLTASAGLHRGQGWATLGLAALHYLSAWMRGSKGGPTAPAADGSVRGDPSDMSRRRVLFEVVHKTSGPLAVALAIAVLLAGLWQLNAARWMWPGLGLWRAVLVAVVIFLERKLRAVDTCQAIWGPDAGHPGNSRRPIGLRVRRLPEAARSFSKDSSATLGAAAPCETVNHSSKAWIIPRSRLQGHRPGLAQSPHPLPHLTYVGRERL